MAYGFVYAGDLALDLGFDGMTPAFWDWVKRHGIEGTYRGCFFFDLEQVKDAVQRDKLAGMLPGAARNGGRVWWLPFPLSLPVRLPPRSFWTSSLTTSGNWWTRGICRAGGRSRRELSGGIQRIFGGLRPVMPPRARR